MADMDRTTTCSVCDAPLRQHELAEHLQWCVLLELPFIERMNRVFELRDRREALARAEAAEAISRPPPYGWGGR